MVIVVESRHFNSSYLFLHVKCFLLTSYWNHVLPQSLDVCAFQQQSVYILSPALSQRKISIILCKSM